MGHFFDNTAYSHANLGLIAIFTIWGAGFVFVAFIYAFGVVINTLEKTLHEVKLLNKDSIKVSKGKSHTSSDSWICSNCNNKNTEGFPFCGNCGQHQ